MHNGDTSATGFLGLHKTENMLQHCWKQGIGLLSFLIQAGTRASCTIMNTDAVVRRNSKQSRDGSLACLM